MNYKKVKQLWWIVHGREFPLHHWNFKEYRKLDVRHIKVKGGKYEGGSCKN